MPATGISRRMKCGPGPTCCSRACATEAGKGAGLQKAGKNEGVVLVPYKADWNKYFLKEKKIIQNEIGDHIWDIEHTGSTSIPEMSSTPVIDILIGVEDLSAIGNFETSLND